MKTVSKHTKGNWTIKGSHIIGYPESNIAIAHVLGNAGQPTEANAKLIAVAPELLEMLIKISNIENHAFTLKGFDVQRLKSEVERAIRKATE